MVQGEASSPPGVGGQGEVGDHLEEVVGEAVGDTPLGEVGVVEGAEETQELEKVKGHQVLLVAWEVLQDWQHRWPSGRERAMGIGHMELGDIT